jgi:predicted TIM-barrel fold metal-dependent hydrolase
LRGARLLVALALMVPALDRAEAEKRLPILDMHVHALAADEQGPPPVGICSPIDPLPTWDPAQPYGAVFMKMLKQPPCRDPVWSPRTDEELMNQTIEEVLVRHPKLRVYIMHAGFPMLDDLLAVLYTHPQVHVDVGVIVFTQPRAAFYRYLRGIVEAGFAKRVMFGSDQMVWPGVIERSIAVIEEARFLSEAAKRDILYHNAARFLRLGEEEIARHHKR